MKDLKGQTAIVTGAGSGIGRGIAVVLAGEGANVVVVGRRPEQIEATVDTIVAAGGSATAMAADVSSEAEVKQVVDGTVGKYGGLEIVCSNAGVYQAAPLAEITESEWDTTMGINARGALFLLQAALPIMREADYGRIIVTSSITGTMTSMPTAAVYAASKAALMGLVRTVAVECAGTAITSNAVLPGTIDTEGLREAGGQDYIDVMLPSIPLGRLGTPEDVAWAVRMLAAPEASYLTGVGLVVDGGQTVPEGRVTSDILAALSAGG